MSRGYATATDLADYLVAKGVAFRDAHEIVGRAVRIAIDADVDLSELTLAQFNEISPIIADDVYKVLQAEGSVASKNVFGGSSPAQVMAQIKRAREELGE